MGVVMKFKIRFIFFLMTKTSKKNLLKEFGSDFYKNFKKLSKQYLEEMIPQVPNIGKSIFSLNYNYGPCYFAWYKALLKLDLEKEKALNLIWQINEDFIKAFPKALLHWFAKNMYLGVFRRMAVEAEYKGKNSMLEPFDWRIEYVDIDKNTFAINIYECGMLKLAQKLGFTEMFPHVCRMDYLFSHYFDNAFKRNGTLGDGCKYCDCWYKFPGQCEWAPEKGFLNRK